MKSCQAEGQKREHGRKEDVSERNGAMADGDSPKRQPQELGLGAARIARLTRDHAVEGGALEVQGLAGPADTLLACGRAEIGYTRVRRKGGAA